jgi:general secretion pathway protein E
VFEVLPVTDDIRKLIEQKESAEAIKKSACQDGMKPLRVSGAMKVAGGITTAEEVIKVAPLA